MPPSPAWNPAMHCPFCGTHDTKVTDSRL
ncbi:MAG: hypothetical protein ACOC0M_09080, partial [Halomonas sp.]